MTPLAQSHNSNGTRALLVETIYLKVYKSTEMLNCCKLVLYYFYESSTNFRVLQKYSNFCWINTYRNYQLSYVVELRVSDCSPATLHFMKVSQTKNNLTK